MESAKDTHLLSLFLWNTLNISCLLLVRHHLLIVHENLLNKDYYISAGSSGGDSNAAQFIVDNRAVLLEYARDGSDRAADKDGSNPRYMGNRDGKKSYTPRSDWLCASVSLSDCFSFYLLDNLFC
jgi:hypothetical protein